jgi:hypothetical protein
MDITTLLKLNVMQPIEAHEQMELERVDRILEAMANELRRLVDDAPTWKDEQIIAQLLEEIDGIRQRAGIRDQVPEMLA